MWIVALEQVAAGTELRFDYENGGANYWQGQPPNETDWRKRSIEPPPPSGVEPTVDFLPSLLAGMPLPWPGR
eukprot:1434169-Prymnesium_polylepis.3